MEKINETNELKELRELGNDAIEKVNEVTPIEHTEATEHKTKHNSIPFRGSVISTCECARCVRCPMK